MDDTELRFINMIFEKYRRMSLENFNALYKKRFSFYPTEGDLARLNFDKDMFIVGVDNFIDSTPDELIKKTRKIVNGIYS